MDRNTLLNSSRNTFMATFRQVIEDVVHRSVARLYEKADKSASVQIQRHVMDARSLLSSREHELVQNIVAQLDTLLQRSFQTAYNTFRPSFFKEAKTAPLALMDITAFEDDLRIDIITSRFRSEAEEQLRDLNIRIAILFERNDIAERENPFRPYMLTRAITLGVEQIRPEPELFVILTDQIGEELLTKVVSIYEDINQHLSECGVAAQLQFKSQRMPSDLTNPVGYENKGDEQLAELPQPRQPASSNADRASPAPARMGRIEQLINIVRSRGNSSAQNGASMFGAGSNEAANSAGFPDAAFAAGQPGGEGAVQPGFENGSASGFGQTQSATAGAGQFGQLINQAGSAVSGWLGGAQEVGDTLRRVFFGAGARATDPGHSYSNADSGAHEDQAGEPWQSASVDMIAISPQLKYALHAPIPSSIEMVGSDGEVRNLIIERRDAFNVLATDQHEKMTIDIVAMLFEFILKDHQVPAEVRAQLGRLQFSVLKMALMDSALLTRKSHPARLLVNRIGSISVGLQQIDPTGERISAEICRIVEELLAQDSENPELFSKMLDQLDSFIASELLASNHMLEQAVQLVTTAEHRSQRHSVESARLEKMLEGILITPYLRRFMLDTWSHVIERVERNPAADSTRFRLLVPNLLWSILPKANRDDRSMLLQIIPIIVPVLREGMSLVAWLPEHQQELLNWLVDAHTLVMRTPISDSPSLTLVDTQRHFHEFIYPDAEPLPVLPQTAKVDVNRVFLDEAIKELEKELQQGDILRDLDRDAGLLTEDDLHDDLESGTEPAAERTLPEGAATKDGADGEFSLDDDTMDRLRSGVVVEINLSGSPTKGRLNWISPNSSNLILTVNGQEAPSIISVRMFRRMLKNSRARFVEVAPLFERAVQSLLESADLVDLAHTP